MLDSHILHRMEVNHTQVARPRVQLVVLMAHREPVRSRVALSRSFTKSPVGMRGEYLAQHNQRSLPRS